MEAILENIRDPSWWFTGIFFAAFALLLPKFLLLLGYLPAFAKGFVRMQRLKRLRKVKNIRFDEIKVIIQGIKTYTWMAIFILGLFVFSYLYLLQPQKFIFLEIENILISGFVSSIFALPIFIVEILYLKQRSFLLLLMKYRARIKAV